MQVQVQPNIVTYSNISYDFQNMIIEERNQEIKELLKQQQEINNIFKDIAILVDEQGEIVDDIRSNITSSVREVDKGTKYLGEAEESQKTGIKLTLAILVATATTVTASILGVIFG